MEYAVKKQLAALALLLIPTLVAFADGGYTPRSGDLIFQISGSRQAEAVRLATGATYGHVGIIFIIDGKPRVLETDATVRYNTLDEFIRRTTDRRYVIKRLRGADTRLTDDVIAKLRRMGDGFVGTGYDRIFNWSDNELYCTELVWKLYQRAMGVELGRLQRLGDFNLSHPAVRTILKERYGEAVPLREQVMSPAQLFASTELVTVHEGRGD
jgi:hypothetical protein